LKDIEFVRVDEKDIFYCGKKYRLGKVKGRVKGEMEWGK